MLSVVIPSRNIPEWPYLQKTVDDLLNKSVEEIEVIVILDGFSPNPPLKVDRRVIVVPHAESQGMRQGINEGASLAKGRYIMKCDDHCMFAEGFDKALKDDCADNWLAVPRRYSLREPWERGYGPLDYLYLTYPYNLDDQFGFGFHGKKWRGEHGVTGGYYDREKKRKSILIDDIISFQGSCWFMPRDLFFRIGMMQIEGYYQHQEAQELCFKVWLSGGRCIVNKNTWYAHLHKSSRGYHMLKHHQIKSNIYATDHWLNNRWPGQVHPVKWLIERDVWWPLECWPVDWDNPKRRENYDYDIWHNAKALRKGEGILCAGSDNKI